MTQKQFDQIGHELWRNFYEVYTAAHPMMNDDQRARTILNLTLSIVRSFALTTHCPKCTAKLIVETAGDLLAEQNLPVAEDCDKKE